MLTIEDRLVYQALGNVIGLKTKNGFEAVIEGHVFAHLLADMTSPFMLRPWKGQLGQYNRFLARFKTLWRKGNRWLLEADIASYYDAIDHELITNHLHAQQVALVEAAACAVDDQYRRGHIFHRLSIVML